MRTTFNWRQTDSEAVHGVNDRNISLFHAISRTDVGTAAPHPADRDEARTGSSEMLAAYNWGYIRGYI